MKRKKRETKSDSAYASHKKIGDNLRLLCTDPRFVDRIRKIRKYLQLPENGFDGAPEDRSKKSETWHHAMYQRSGEIANDPKFMAKLRAYREDLNNHKIVLSEYKKLLSELHDPIPVNYFTRQIKNLLDEFNVPVNFENSIRYFILYNDAMWIPSTTYSITPGTPENRHERAVTLVLRSKLTDQILKQLKHEVNNIFGKELPRIGSIKNLESKLAVERYYYHDRERYDEVSGTPYMLSVLEISEQVKDETGKTIKPQDIYETTRSLRRLRKKKFAKRTGKK